MLPREFAGRYAVEQLLPQSDTGEVPTYLVTSLNDGHRRIVAEHDLTPA